MTTEASALDDARLALYGGSRATFVERRRELAGEARRRGDRDQAKHIEKMRKPAAAAHLVNLLAHADDSSLCELVELGASIRRAMAEGDDRDMRSLLRGRAGAISETVAQAYEIARASGESVSGAVSDQVVQTLRAAMASDDAAAAVRRGTLTDALDEPGFDGVSVDATARSRVRAPAPTRSGSRGKAKSKSDVADDREAQAATGAAARERLTAAAAAVKLAEQALASATKRRDGLGRRRDHLAVQLEQIDAELTKVRADVDEVEARLGDAVAEMKAADGATPD